MLVESASLTVDDLRLLVRASALAIRVAGYVTPEVCAEVPPKVLRSVAADADRKRIYQSNVRAFTDTGGDRLARQHYLQSSPDAMAAVRMMCSPYPSPVDRFRCELDEIWPAGAALLRVGQRPLVFGMARAWQDGAGALPHLDVLGATAPEVVEARRFATQLGVNMYLQVPGTGHGELEMWNLTVDDVSVREHGIEATYGFRYELLPPPDLVITPRAGDLLVLRSDRIHAVRPTRAGRRITFSGFVGAVDEATPLRLWS